MEVKQTGSILKGLIFNLGIFLIEINCLIDGVHEAGLEINKNHICQGDQQAYYL